MIDINVPKPQRSANKGRAKKYDLSPMDIGDSSFYAFGEGEDEYKIRVAMNTSAIYQNRGGRYSTSKVKEDEKLGIRIWRIE